MKSDKIMLKEAKMNIAQDSTTAGLEEFAELKSADIDMGKIKSRDLGNMLSGELVALGKLVAKKQNPNVDYGSLPSEELTELGKLALHNDILRQE